MNDDNPMNRVLLVPAGEMPKSHLDYLRDNGIIAVEILGDPSDVVVAMHNPNTQKGG